MPVIEPASSVNKPWYMLNAHLETVLPFVDDMKEPDLYQRERLELEDGDFLDLDWISNQSSKLILISHGLEGNSQSYYARSAAKHFARKNWDVLAWNFRSCSREINRTQRLYHFGETKDINSVVNHAVALKKYEKIVLLGYSIGGSITLKYLGEKEPHPSIRGAATFSVPCDYAKSLKLMGKWWNIPYKKKILNKLNTKLQKKANQFDWDRKAPVKSITEFNERVILPIYKFQNLEELYYQSSCLHFFGGIKLPVLIANALNDPLLGEGCYPYEAAKDHPSVYLETPKHGGHVGFTSKNKTNWMDERAEQFIDEFLE